jgi:hypothetical protein
MRATLTSRPGFVGSPKRRMPRDHRANVADDDPGRDCRARSWQSRFPPSPEKFTITHGKIPPMNLSILHISDLHHDPENPIRNDVLLDCLVVDLRHYT